MTEAQVKAAFARRPKSKSLIKRRSLSRPLRAAVFAKTRGTCHVCGGAGGDGWQADHVVPHTHGGECTVENFLPICAECNSLRWGYEPDVLRLMLRIGRYAKHEIREDTPLGRALVRLVVRRSNSAAKRRRLTLTGGGA